MGLFSKKKKVVAVEETVTTTTTADLKKEEGFAQVSPKNVGKLDMVIAFDTTGSMAQYIEAVRKEVSELSAMTNGVGVPFHTGYKTAELVRASVVRNQKAPLLLGQSVLGRLGSIEMDNPGKKLIITHSK